MMSTENVDKDDPSPYSRRPARSSEAPESVTYELEDHLALCKKTPTPPLTPTAQRDDDSGFAFAAVRFGGEPGRRDTLLMEIPEIEGGEDSGVAMAMESGPEEEGGEAPFDSLLIRGAPLSPVAEMDETQRSARATGHSSFLTTSATTQPPRSTTHLDRRSTEKTQGSSPVQGVVENEHGEKERRRGSGKSVRRSKQDLPVRDVSDMMEVDDGRECNAKGEDGQQTPRRSRSEETAASNLGRRSRSIKKGSRSHRSSTRGHSQTPQRKRCSTTFEPLKEALLEKLSSEVGSWTNDLFLYLRVRLLDMNLTLMQQLTSHVDKLLADPTDAESWLEFLRLELHKTIQIDTVESLRWIQTSGECPPSLRTLYLWALKLSQSQEAAASYQTLIHDERQLGLAPSSAEGFLLDAVFQLCHMEERSISLGNSTPPRSTDISLRQTVKDLVDVETQLIQALQNQ